jgi:exopolysaccharide production protein ExoZ
MAKTVGQQLGSGNPAKSGLQPYSTLDMWRGAACLMVVLYHEGFILTTRYPQLSSFPLYRAGTFGYLGVQMFFVISGYCIAGAACSALRRGDGWKAFMFARARRVYPPLWLSLVLTVLLAQVARVLVASGRLHGSALAGFDALHQSPAYYFSNLTLTQMILHQNFLSIVCWTLCYEVAFYLIVSLFLIWTPLGREEVGLLSSLHVLTVCALIMLTLAPQLRFFPLDLWPQFGMGVIVYDVLKHPHQVRPRWWLLAIGLATGAFVCSRSLAMSLQHEPSRLTFAFTLWFALLLLYLYRHDGALRRMLVVRGLISVGLFSYSLYLTHLLMLGIVNQVFRTAHLAASAHLLILGTCLVVAVLFARLFFHWFERPFLHMRRQIPPPPAAGLEPAFSESRQS